MAYTWRCGLGWVQAASLHCNLLSQCPGDVDLGHPQPFVLTQPVQLCLACMLKVNS